MPDLRFDPVNHLWVAIAENRSKRPNEFHVVDQDKPLGTCPFCGGHEEETPPEFSTTHYSDLPDSICSQIFDDSQKLFLPPISQDAWITRTVPNRYPAFGPGTENNGLDTCEHSGVVARDTNTFQGSGEGFSSGPYQTRQGLASRQYLIIESPRHVTGYSDLNDTEVLSAFLCYKKTLQTLSENQQFQHVMLFKNCRPAAGASLAHVHTQVVALDFVPDSISRRTIRLEESIASGNGLLKEILEFELNEEQRIVYEGSDWVVFCPFASRFPFQTWILPKTMTGPIWELEDSVLADLGILVRKTLQAFDKATKKSAYNVLFHQPPFRKEEKPARWSGHSFTEIFARSNGPAGFEWGTDCWINPVSPEHAALSLKSNWN